MDDVSAESSVTAIAESVRLSVTRLARLLRQQDGSGLSPSMTSVLAVLHHQGPLSLGELAAREHVSAPTITRVVEKLQQLGLAKRTTSAADGRMAFAELTGKGRRAIVDARSRRTQWLIDHLETLPAEDLDALARAAPVLERLVTAERKP